MDTGEGKIYFAEPKDTATVTLKTENGVLGTFKYDRQAGTMTAQQTEPEKPAEPADPGHETPEAPGTGESPASAPLKLSVKETFGDWRMVMESSASAAEIKGLLVNGRTYESVEAKWFAFYSYKYYLDSYLSIIWTRRRARSISSSLEPAIR